MVSLAPLSQFRFGKATSRGLDLNCIYFQSGRAVLGQGGVNVTISIYHSGLTVSLGLVISPEEILLCRTRELCTLVLPRSLLGLQHVLNARAPEVIQRLKATPNRRMRVAESFEPDPLWMLTLLKVGIGLRGQCSIKDQ